MKLKNNFQTSFVQTINKNFCRFLHEILLWSFFLYTFLFLFLITAAAVMYMQEIVYK